MSWDRRDFLKATSVTVAGLSVMPGLASKPVSVDPPICVFSKCLQFINYEELGVRIAEMGFDGADLTVRKNGHVLPENVKVDLPRAVRALQKAGVDVPMIVTDINDATNPYVEDILGTAVDLGIKYYRMGYFRYDPKLTIFDSLDNNKRKLDGLEKINRKYHIQSGYQNHSGPWGMVGGAVWDLHYLFHGFSPEYVGIQYDIAHATAEGGFTWEVAFKVIEPWINSLAIKDFIWQKGDERWKTKWVPLGEGMVNFKKYSEQVSPFLSTFPVTIHYEYDLGGAESGKQTPTMSHEKIYRELKKDLHYFKYNIKQLKT